MREGDGCATSRTSAVRASGLLCAAIFSGAFLPTQGEMPGRWCRSFERADLSGIACHDDADWQLVMTAPGAAPQSTEYRQAGSGTSLVMEAAGNMMADAPLDAEAERRMRDRGWTE